MSSWRKSWIGLTIFPRYESYVKNYGGKMYVNIYDFVSIVCPHFVGISYSVNFKQLEKSRFKIVFLIKKFQIERILYIYL